MIISNNLAKAADFEVEINHNNIPQTNNVKYLGVILDNTLSWQSHIDKTSNKLLRVCGMAFKLRHYSPYLL